MKRSREQIVRDILALLARDGPQGKTHIVYGCGLAFKPTRKYLEDLVQAGQIAKISTDVRPKWAITERGRTTLRHLAAVIR